MTKFTPTAKMEPTRLRQALVPTLRKLNAVGFCDISLADVRAFFGGELKIGARNVIRKSVERALPRSWPRGLRTLAAAHELR